MEISLKRLTLMIIKNKQKVSKKLHKKLKVFYLTIICNFLDDILNYQEAYFAEICLQ